MAMRESEALLAATQQLIDETRVDQRFTALDIRRMHRRWLGAIYPWAGDYRSVNVSKAGFMFAAAGLVGSLMDELERGSLRQFTPCRFDFGGIRGRVKQRYIAAVHAGLLDLLPDPA